ncbi:MAG: (Fe-S)-binding protein [Bacteriovoracaceae bacterium]|nr:(Fe-S)-binding protein [Bacteriovoracaceae bacterium]
MKDKKTQDSKNQKLECIQCNKCMVTCPLNKVDPTYSPRGRNLQLLMEGQESFSEDQQLYRCLTCFQCMETCPSNNQYVEVVKSARKDAHEKGHCDECKHGSILRSITQLQADLNVKQNRLEGLDPDSYADSGEIFYFMGCLPIFDQVFTHTDSLKIAKNTLKIFNHLGIKPMMTDEEKCCGYDLLWSGQEEYYLKLAKSNLKMLKDKGVKKIVTSCAECFITLKDEYSKIEKIDWEVQHVTEFIAENIKNGKLKLDKEVAKQVTYHDPCRLGRVGKVFDAPREILENVPGVDFKEMEFTKENSACCGVGNFSNCDTHTKFLQNERLLEAKEAGAKYMLTACPKCRIHFNCYLDGEPIDKMEELEITDITEIVAQGLETGEDK